MAKLSPQGPFRAFSFDGEPLDGGLLYTYEAGTTTPKVTYTTESSVTPNTNPVVLDSDGYANVWLGDGSYKLVLKDSAGVTQWTIDDVVGDASQGFASTVINQGTNLIITEGYANYFINATASITLSLLAASSAGDGFYFTVKASNGNVTIDPDGSELIDGAATKSIFSGASALVICNGTVWYTAFYMTSANFAGGTLILPQATVPAQTAEGSVVWDTDNDLLTVGDGSSRKTMVDVESAQTVTGLKQFTQQMEILGTSAEQASIILHEDTDNGNNYIAIVAPAAVASNKSQSLQNAAGTIALTADIPTQAFGTYTPTLTNTTNVSASTAGVCRYFRYGNYVTVFGSVQIDAVSTATTILMGMSLPIASNFANTYDAGGTALGIAYDGAVNSIYGYAIIADVTNDRASFVGNANSLANNTYSFHFSYFVI